MSRRNFEQMILERDPQDFAEMKQDQAVTELVEAIFTPRTK